MNINVILLAAYREKTGLTRLSLDMAPDSDVADLAAEMKTRFPQLPDPERIVIAVNDEYRDRDFTLSDGDEAALIPPVSGG